MGQSVQPHALKREEEGEEYIFFFLVLQFKEMAKENLPGNSFQ